MYKAAFAGDLAEVKQQVAAGGDVNCTVGGHNITPLHAAICNKHTAVAEYLISLPGCDLEARCSKGWTPLHYAGCYHSNIDIVKTLLDKGAQVNARTDDGHTALYWAIVRGHTAVAEYLISLPQCDIQNVDGGGKTVLDKAKKENNTNIIALLEKRASGTPPNEVIKVSKGQTSVVSKVQKSVVSKDKTSSSVQQEKKQLQAFTQCLQEELDQFTRNEQSGGHGSDDLTKKVDKIQKDLETALVKIDELTIKSETQGASAAAVGQEAQMPGLVREASSLYSRCKSARSRDPGLTDRKLLQVAKELGSEWKTLGGFLGVPHTDIESIDQNYPRETLYCGWRMLIKWRDGHKGKASDQKEALKGALKDQGKMNIVELL